MIKRFIWLYNEIMIKKEHIQCSKCKKKILKTDKYCQFCGKAMETKSFLPFRSKHQ